MVNCSTFYILERSEKVKRWTRFQCAGVSELEQEGAWGEYLAALWDGQQTGQQGGEHDDGGDGDNDNDNDNDNDKDNYNDGW